MTDETVVSFGASTSGLEAGVETVKTEIRSIDPVVAELAAEMKSLAASIDASFKAMSVSVTGALNKLKTEVHEHDEHEAGLVGAFSGLHERIEETLGPINRVREAIAGIGEAFIAAFAVEQVVEFAKKMGEAGENTEHTAERLGVSIGEVQRLGAAATVTGLNADALSTAVGRLYRNFAQAEGGSKAQASAFKELGVNLKDVHNQQDLLTQVFEKFPDLSGPIQKSQVAMALFGRTGLALIPFLDQGAAGLKVVGELTEKYGVENEAAVEKSASLGEAFNENKLAMQGVGNVMADELAPAFEQIVRGANDLIARFTASYRSGGLVRQVMDGLTIVVRALVAALVELGLMLDVVFRGFLILQDAMKGAGNIIGGTLGGAVGLLIVQFVTLGRVMNDIFSGNFRAAVADAAAGVRGMATVVHDAYTRIAADAGKAGADGGKQFAQAFRDSATGNRWIAGLISGKGIGGNPLPKREGEPSEDDLQGIPKGAGKKGKAPNEGDVVAEWKQELADRLEADRQFGQDDAAITLAFWQARLADVKAGTKDEIAVQREIVAAERAVAKERVELATEAARSTSQIETTRAKTRLDEAKSNAATEIALIDEAEKAKLITARQAIAQRAAINAQLRAMEKEETDEEYRLREQALRAELADISLTPVARARINDQILALQAEHESKMVALAGQSARDQANALIQSVQRTQEAGRQYVSPIVGAWTSGFARIAQGSGNLRDILVNSWAGLTNVIAQQIDRMVTNWITQQLFMTSAQRAALAAQASAHIAAETVKTGATVGGVAARTAAETTGAATSRTLSLGTMIMDVTHAAIRAAANTWAAISSIPVVGPFLAPAAAAAALAGVIALIASAEGGWGEIPADQLAMVHKKEMILPAEYASPLRDMLKGGGLSAGPAGTAGPAAAAAGAQARSQVAGGDTYHLHYNPEISNPDPDLHRLLTTQGGSLIKWLRNSGRNAVKLGSR